MELRVYLSGEIHSNWREEIKGRCKELNLPIICLSPITDHSASDNVGTDILGEEINPFWKDHKSAKINAIRTKTFIEKSDLVVVKFGDKYRQWNAAFDTGFASALGKPTIIIHTEEFTHALKEVDSSANAVVNNIEQVIKILQYITSK